MRHEVRTGSNKTRAYFVLNTVIFDPINKSGMRYAQDLTKPELPKSYRSAVWPHGHPKAGGGTSSRDLTAVLAKKISERCRLTLDYTQEGGRKKVGNKESFWKLEALGNCDLVSSRLSLPTRRFHLARRIPRLPLKLA